MKDIKLLLQSTKQLNVLYVEDDLVLLKSTKELLENYFKSVDSAEDGQEGLQKYMDYHKANNKYYDLIITDINMPNLNGIDMSKEILKENFSQTILIVSAHNEIEYLASAIDIGIDGFVNKPIRTLQFHLVLYKSAQAIIDRKFVEEYVSQIEELNLHLEEQNRELLLRNQELEKSTRLLNTMVYKDKKNKKQEEDKSKEQIQEQIQELINDELYELREIHTEIDVQIIKVIDNYENLDSTSIPNLTKLFGKYASTLALYSFFDNLSLSMANFSRVLQENPLPKNQERVKNVFILLESFIFVLGKWQDDLLSADESVINSLDDSMISDMHTITNLYTQQENEECEEDALDDIFDF